MRGKALQISEDNVKVAEQRARAGLATYNEVAEAYHTLKETQIKYIGDIYQYQIQKLALDNATSVGPASVS